MLTATAVKPGFFDSILRPKLHYAHSASGLGGPVALRRWGDVAPPPIFLDSGATIG